MSAYDVAIIGGGPGGSTTGALLAKYNPKLRIVILERAKFPRDHVGESQLPPLCRVLDEMGCWDDVEAAGFPIKIGATYRWGSTNQLWDFEFLPLDQFRDEPRPAKYAGQRLFTAFQVERARYDEILLNQAEALGCEVRQSTGVESVRMSGDEVTELSLKGGEQVKARWYVDASGHSGILRRAAGVETEIPTRLRNIAIWDYWENAKWAAEIGVGGTRVQVMSQRFGWLWFIPLGPTRTSIGLVCPLDYYKGQPLSPEELYAKAVAEDPRIGPLTRGASLRGKVETTKDWSFVSERATGRNWMLVGEACGFADPILAAGLTLTQVGGREAAYTLLSLLAGEHDPSWLCTHYEKNQLSRIRQHIRFADFWYACNGQFSDLKDHCQSIAEDAGLLLSADAAWAWLAQGGFTLDVIDQAGIGGLDLAAVKQVSQRFTGDKADWQASRYNVFKLKTEGAEFVRVPVYKSGRVTAAPALSRDGRRLVLAGLFGLVAKVTEPGIGLNDLMLQLKATLTNQLGASQLQTAMYQAFQILEVMLSEGWLVGELQPDGPRLSLNTPDNGAIIHDNVDAN